MITEEQYDEENLQAAINESLKTTTATAVNVEDNVDAIEIIEVRPVEAKVPVAVAVAVPVAVAAERGGGGGGGGGEGGESDK